MLRVDFRSSIQAGIVLAVLHLGSVIILAACDVHWTLLAIVSAFVLLQFVWLWLALVLRSLPWSVIGISIDKERLLKLHFRNGRSANCQLLGSTLVSTPLTFLHCRPIPGRAQAIAIFPDMVDRDAYRQLRLILRTSKD